MTFYQQYYMEEQLYTYTKNVNTFQKSNSIHIRLICVDLKYQYIKYSNQIRKQEMFQVWKTCIKYARIILQHCHNLCYEEKWLSPFWNPFYKTRLKIKSI